MLSQSSLPILSLIVSGTAVELWDSPWCQIDQVILFSSFYLVGNYSKHRRWGLGSSLVLNQRSCCPSIFFSRLSVTIWRFPDLFRSCSWVTPFWQCESSVFFANAIDKKPFFFWFSSGLALNRAALLTTWCPWEMVWKTHSFFRWDHLSCCGKSFPFADAAWKKLLRVFFCVFDWPVSLGSIWVESDCVTTVIDMYSAESSSSDVEFEPAPTKFSGKHRPSSKDNQDVGKRREWSNKVQKNSKTTAIWTWRASCLKFWVWCDQAECF